MKLHHSRNGESGIALVTTLLVLVIVASLMTGFFALVSSDQQANAAGRDQTQAYAAAHAGLEKLTSDLSTLFSSDVSPSVAELNELMTYPPSIPGYEFRAPGGGSGSGYAFTWTPDANGNPAPEGGANGSNITAGPYKGFKGIITKYPITVTARPTNGGAEVRLRRVIQTVAVPVFQFGVFSQNDLTFYAGDHFNFGGRVHTNGHLFLSQLSGYTLTFPDKITAVGEVVRARFSNGLSVTSNAFSGVVNITRNVGAGPFRDLQENEGSVTNMPGSTATSNWVTLSTGTYNSVIRNGLTGAQTLNLPIVTDGATPIDLIRRPPANEGTTNPAVLNQRLFTMASLRILLSDTAADITGLPSVTNTAPIALDGDWIASPPTGYGPVSSTRPPLARSIGPISNTTTSGSTYSSPNAQIRVSGSIAGGFKIPATMTAGSNTAVACTGKTTTTFIGCTGITAAVSNGSAVTATLPSGATAATTTTASASAGATTLTVASTAAFAPGLIWVNGTAVTCEGYDAALSPQRFTNCRGLTAAPASGVTISTHALADQNTTLHGGFIKIERQASNGTWTDVTAEILNLGFAQTNQAGALCTNTNADAVVVLQRLRDNGGGTCTYSGSTNPHDYWPNALYDTREGLYRDVSTSSSTVYLGGVMHYVGLNVGNLKRWFAGSIGSTGNQAWNNNGYIVYFSDRRGDRNDAGNETGEYGFEDFVNPLSSTGAQNTTLDTGEDVNGNNALERYGETPAAGAIPSGAADPYSSNGRPWSAVSGTAAFNAPIATTNRQVLFRRALKLYNGGISSGVNNLPASGLTVVAENPVYVQGNYNATTDPAAEPNVPAAIMADAVTILSNNWSDALSFRQPNDRTNRDATTTGYRFGVVAGKSLSFPWPTAGSPHFLFGTDGGVGNFLRLLEDWNTSGASINYKGSIVSLFISRQAVGTFKYGPNVYYYNNRNFTFDTDFLLPSLLPPGTPMFRDVNTLTFRQLLRPTE